MKPTPDPASQAGSSDSLIGLNVPPGTDPALLHVLDRIRRVYASNVEAYQDEVLDEIELIFQEYQHGVLDFFTALYRGTDPVSTEPFRQARQRAKRRIAVLQSPAVQALATNTATRPTRPKPLRPVSARHPASPGVAIFSEKMLQNDPFGLLPCEAYAFGWTSAPDGALGIRLLWHSPLFGLRVSNLLQTGSEEDLRRFARQVVARHKRERWVLESELHPELNIR